MMGLDACRNSVKIVYHVLFSLAHFLVAVTCCWLLRLASLAPLANHQTNEAGGNAKKYQIYKDSE